MDRLSQEINVQFIDSLQCSEDNIEAITAQLENKGKELSQSLDGIEDLDGSVEIKDDVHILRECPLLSVVREIKRRHAASEGEEEFPGYLRQIRETYLRRFPDTAILHPLCIFHQHIRKAVGEKWGVTVEDIACRDAATGTVAVAAGKRLPRHLTPRKNVSDEFSCAVRFSCVYRCWGKKKARSGAAATIVKMLERIPVWALGKGVTQNWW